MKVFVDTSAYMSLLGLDDLNHGHARAQWTQLLEHDADVVTSNYIVVETIALLQNRSGLAAVNDFVENLLPVADVVWIDQLVHHTAMTALQTANRRQLSLVDCVSFELCRRLRIDRVFAFDRHFQEQGFRALA